MFGEDNTVERINIVDAAHFQGRVQGHTHIMYKYPARFSPVFARSAIETFTEPGDVVLDPFVGGGTTLVEARLAGRHAIGSDISTLAVFLTQVKSIALTECELEQVEKWFNSVPERLNIHKPVKNLRTSAFDGYDRNMPWRLRKLCEQYLLSVEELSSVRLQRFARCVLLKCGQLAMDCRKEIPTVEFFRSTLVASLALATRGMREYVDSIAKSEEKYGINTYFECAHLRASDLKNDTFNNSILAKPKLVLTSPPYPGVHVLYHRWSVRGRRETPAPFWLANCMDGHGATHYTLGDRKQERLPDYYSGITESFTAIHDIVADDAIVVQIIAFSSPEWQLDAYLDSMSKAGFCEVMPATLKIDCDNRLWRTVPGRRWYSVMRGKIPSSTELVLFHRKT